MSLSLLPSTLVALAILLAGPATRDDPNFENRIDGQGLLREAHDLAAGLAPEQRAGVLSRAAHGAGALKMPEAKLWSQELFDLAPSLKPGEAETVRQSAATAMAKADPAAGLKLLLAVQPAPRPEAMRHLFAHMYRNIPELRVTSSVFLAYFDGYGFAGLPELQSAALKLGTSGEYPFSAWSKIVVKLEATNSIRAQEVLKQILDAALRTYPNPDPVEDDLMQFLEQTSEAIPRGTRQEVMQIAVRRIVENPEAESAGQYDISLGSQPARFTNSVDAKLYRYLSMIRTVDPELAENLLKTRPELAAAPKPETPPCCGGMISASATTSFSVPSRAGIQGGAGFGSGGGRDLRSASSMSPTAHAMPPRIRRDIEVINVMKQASDPQAATRAADAMTDDTARAKAYAQLASQNGFDPVAGGELLTKANAVCSKQDAEDQMDCLPAIASAYLRRRDVKAFEDAASRFLALAAAAPQGERTSVMSGFSWGILASGLQSFPQETLRVIRSTPDPGLRAVLLADAAIAPTRSRRQHGDILMDLQ